MVRHELDPGLGIDHVVMNIGVGLRLIRVEQILDRAVAGLLKSVVCDLGICGNACQTGPGQVFEDVVGDGALQIQQRRFLIVVDAKAQRIEGTAVNYHLGLGLVEPITGFMSPKTNAGTCFLPIIAAECAAFDRQFGSSRGAVVLLIAFLHGPLQQSAAVVSGQREILNGNIGSICINNIQDDAVCAAGD